MAGPDIKNIESLPALIPSSDAPAPERDTNNLDALLTSLNASAERFQTLWFSFLGLTLYLVIAARGTTHRDLLLNNPQILPILNVKVDLLLFYIVAPLLYLVFHFYVLMMLVLLGRTAEPFERQLQTTLLDKADQELYRARVENTLFLQTLVGMRGERAGFNGNLLKLIAIITVVLAPILTLVLIQMMFLPYHSLGIGWWQRTLVLADLGLIIVMTRRFFTPGDIEGPPSRLPGYLAELCLVFGVLWLSFWEGRWAGEPFIGRQDFASTAKGVVFGWFPDRLNLRGETIVADEQMEKTQKEIVSRGGGFVPTIKLDDRDLQAADLSGADLRGVSLEGANMWRANLSDVQLQGADLTTAVLHAFLGRAHLQGARLTKAHLDGAYLAGAQLQGADLDSAQLAGANLGDARLEGSNLASAELSGTSLFGAALQGADLQGAVLLGADLRYAKLQGASLHGALLQAANLSGAQLQGADISGADLSSSTFDGTFVFRTSISQANLSDSYIRSVRAGNKFDPSGPGESMAAPDVDALVADATKFARGDEKADVKARFVRLRRDFQTADQDAYDHQKWVDLEDLDRSRDPAGVEHRRRLAAIVGDLVCRRYGAPYVARGLVTWGQDRLAALGDQLEGVRKRMKAGREKSETCPGVVGFVGIDWTRLDSIKPN